MPHSHEVEGNEKDLSSLVNFPIENFSAGLACLLCFCFFLQSAPTKENSEENKTQKAEKAGKMAVYFYFK